MHIHSRPILVSRSWLILGLVVGFLLAAGTAILSSVSTRGLAESSARIDQQLADLNRRIEASHTGLPSAAATVVSDKEQLELFRLALDSAAITQRAEYFQRVSVWLLALACFLGGAGALLLKRRMHQLEDMITVCAWTKRVRFNGKWVSFEDYLHARFNLQFTHGISEEALLKLRKETEEYTTRQTPPQPAPSLTRA